MGRQRKIEEEQVKGKEVKEIDKADRRRDWKRGGVEERVRGGGQRGNTTNRNSKTGQTTAECLKRPVKFLNPACWTRTTDIDSQSSNSCIYSIFPVLIEPFQ